MDLRVLVGVFVTLFGIAVGMAGGDIQTQDLLEMMENGDLSAGMSGFGSLSELVSFERTKPANTSITADLTSKEDTDLHIESPATLKVYVIPSAKVTVGDATFMPLTQDTDKHTALTFRGFTGHVKTGNNISISGKIRAIDTASLNMNYSRPKTIALPSAAIQAVNLSEVKNQHIVFEDAEGTIETGATDITLSKEQASFEFFRGELSIAQSGDTFDYLFDGHIHRGTLGDSGSQLTIGGKK